MKQSIYPCIWFDGKAGEALNWYVTIFPNSKIVDATPMVTTADLLGCRVMGLNGGPMFTPNASISFMILINDAATIRKIYEQLSEDGMIMMPLDSYAWSSCYAFIQDKYGVSWQLYTGADTGQQLVPTLMFSQEQQGRAAEAVQLYTNLFQPSEQQGIAAYPDGEMKGQVMHAQFTLQGYTLMAMDSGVPQPFSFTEGVSLVVNCNTQAEIDHLWNGLIADGGAESMCGWCKDKFGVSWQIIPASLATLMQEPASGKRVMDALPKMKKLDIAILENA